MAEAKKEKPKGFSKEQKNGQKGLNALLQPQRKKKP